MVADDDDGWVDDHDHDVNSDKIKQSNKFPFLPKTNKVGQTFTLLSLTRSAPCCVHCNVFVWTSF